ncbi:hypothetical protein GJ744_011020 [Endocarpon pusillum]|uniref:Uncharacterized protein n=1 Tax=Endocarpon pusillum TaxID=364733 RepID=A0A8H7E521_9EURO|nr:hypothetical protein GJ744_011020 [Endocarpon pusillum]
MFFYILVLGLLLFGANSTEAAAFTTSPVTAIHQPMNEVSSVQKSAVVSEVPSISATSPSPTSVPLTSLPALSRVTTPPSSNHLELRQRCWNDQGFSVDCAVWTGYRYSWGPAANPYDYWSGGGTGSGGSGGASSGASESQSMQGYTAVLLVACIGIGISSTFLLS